MLFQGVQYPGFQEPETFYIRDQRPGAGDGLTAVRRPEGERGKGFSSFEAIEAAFGEETVSNSGRGTDADFVVMIPNGYYVFRNIIKEK